MATPAWFSRCVGSRPEWPAPVMAIWLRMIIPSDNIIGYSEILCLGMDGPAQLSDFSAMTRISQTIPTFDLCGEETDFPDVLNV